VGRSEFNLSIKIIPDPLQALPNSDIWLRICDCCRCWHRYPSVVSRSSSPNTQLKKLVQQCSQESGEIFAGNETTDARAQPVSCRGDTGTCYCVCDPHETTSRRLIPVKSTRPTDA